MTPSIIRTTVAVVAGWLIGHGVAAWLGVDDATLTNLLAGIATVVYYVAIRVLEARWPRLGLLLGVPSPPVYGRAEVLAAILRTLVPFLASVAIHLGILKLGVDEDAVNAALTWALTTGYYSGLRWLEQRPRLGWVGVLLGFPAAPAYADPIDLTNLED